MSGVRSPFGSRLRDPRGAAAEAGADGFAGATATANAAAAPLLAAAWRSGAGAADGVGTAAEVTSASPGDGDGADVIRTTPKATSAPATAR